VAAPVRSYGGAVDGDRRSTTWLLLAGGMALFGSATPVSRLVGRELPSLVASGLRMAIAAVVLVPVLVWWERRSDRGVLERLRATSPADRWSLAGIAVIGTFGFSVLLVLGMRLVPGATGAVVMALTPAVTAAGAVIFLGDRLDGRLMGALVLGVAGVVVVNLGAPPEGGGGNAVLGSMLVFGAVCAEATYTLLGKRLSVDFDMIEISTVAAVGGLAAFAVPGLFQLGDVGWSTLGPETWWGVLWWGLGTMALGSVVWFAGVRRVRGVVASVFMTVMPVSALLLSYVLLGESFSPWHLVGMAAVVAGILLVATREDG
jgi:drug/metabolite transporter (DMT)-like permease